MAFDLDNEELKATRKMRGLDDGLYEDKINRTANEIATNVGIDFSEAKATIMQFSMNNKTSDKNVANIEDDVKILRKFINEAQDLNNENGWHGYYDVEIKAISNAIEHILTERKQDKNELQKSWNNNLELSKQLKDARDKVQELEAENRENKKKYLALLMGQFPDATETYKKYEKELQELLGGEK